MAGAGEKAAVTQGVTAILQEASIDHMIEGGMLEELGTECQVCGYSGQHVSKSCR